MKSLNKSLLSKDNFIIWLKNISLNDNDPSIRQIASEILPLVAEDFPVPPKPQYELLYSKYKFRLTTIKTEFGFRNSLQTLDGKNKFSGIIESRSSVFINPPQPSPSQTPTPEVTPSVTPSNTPSISITPSNSSTPSATPSVTPTISGTPSETPTPSESTTPFGTPTPSQTPSQTPTPSETVTPTQTPTPSEPS